MRTEIIKPPQHLRREQALSPALLPQSPRWITVTTSRGREVPVSLAGYRLRLGHKYQLRIASPAREVRLVGFPRLLVERRGEPHFVADEPHSYFCQNISVCSAGFWSMITQLGIYPEELEMEVVLDDGRRVSIALPVVLELGFTVKIVLLLVLWAMLSSLFELLTSALTEQRFELLSSPAPWIRGFCLALLYPVVTFVRRVWGLRKRAGELHQRFRRNWRGPDAATQSGDAV